MFLNMDIDIGLTGNVTSEAPDVFGSEGSGVTKTERATGDDIAAIWCDEEELIGPAKSASNNDKALVDDHVDYWRPWESP